MEYDFLPSKPSGLNKFLEDEIIDRYHHHVHGCEFVPQTIVHYVLVFYVEEKVLETLCTGDNHEDGKQP